MSHESESWAFVHLHLTTTQHNTTTPHTRGMSTPSSFFKTLNVAFSFSLLLSYFPIAAANHKDYLSGINLQPSYYNYGNVTMGWDLMKQYAQIQSVRIEIEPDMVDMGQEWIRQASEGGVPRDCDLSQVQCLGERRCGGADDGCGVVERELLFPLSGGSLRREFDE